MISPIEPMLVNQSNLAVFRQDRQDAVALADALELEQSLVELDLTGIKLGLSVLNLDNPYFAALARGAREEAARLGLELVSADGPRGQFCVLHGPGSQNPVVHRSIGEGASCALSTVATQVAKSLPRT